MSTDPLPAQPVASRPRRFIPIPSPPRTAPSRERGSRCHLRRRESRPARCARLCARPRTPRRDGPRGAPQRRTGGAARCRSWPHSARFPPHPRAVFAPPRACGHPGCARLGGDGEALRGSVGSETACPALSSVTFLLFLCATDSSFRFSSFRGARR